VKFFAIECSTKHAMNKNRRDRVVAPFGWICFYLATFASEAVWTLYVPLKSPVVSGEVTVVSWEAAGVSWNAAVACQVIRATVNVATVVSHIASVHSLGARAAIGFARVAY
jgi:hypothetical protein